MRNQKLRKKRFIIATILWILLLNSGLFLIYFNNNLPFAIENDQIKSSDGEIQIITPKNKTYTAPMSGYYPATYGFENDNAGDDPEDWVIETEDGGNIEVLGELYGHKKVIRIRDTSGIYGIILHQSFNDNIISGTVEFWICTRYSYNFQGTIHPTIIQIGDEKAGDVGLHACAIYFGRNNGNISVYNGDVLIDVFTNLLINYWYHIKIEFDCSDDWHLWVNGIQTDVSGYNFRGSPSSMTQFRIATGGSQSPISFVDAIGYSWDPKYNVGDSLHEGLFINYETTASLVWEAFSLDGSINKTILGDTTIAMPDFGSHTIQIYGTDSIGTIFESDIRHFEVSPMNLITPENITYTEPMRGNYPGTYSFDNDKNGVDPLDWIDRGGDSNVVNEFERHKKVLQLYYPGSGPNQIQVSNIFKSTPNCGTIEFWLAERFTSTPIQAQIRKIGIGQCFGIRIINDKFQFYDGAWHNVGRLAVDREWYHIRLDFETSVGGYMGLSQWNWRLLINSESFSPYNFSTNAIPDFLQFYANFGDLAYVDALGYSWDPYYNIGDNLYEGILVGLEYSPYLEWMGYSLDNQPYKPIKGNTTIPLPSNTSHSIQIFGNDSLSHNYYTELRYFTIEYPIELFTSNPGTWEDLFTITVDSYPAKVFIGDANNDGYNDIVASTYEIDEIKIILWNTTSQTWNPYISKSAGDNPYGITIGDVNNDSYNDIVVTNSFGDNISIFLWNESSNNWDSQILKSVGDQPSEIVIGDANNDGYNDIIILNSGNDVSIILWNISTNDWNPQIRRNIGPYPISLAFGDVNNDGDNDIITSSMGVDDRIHILLWNSSLNDWSHINRRAKDQPMGVFVGDANNDGFNDMIVSNYDDEEISIFLWNESSRNWDSQIKKLVGDTPRETFIEDVNNDGYNDITVLNIVDGYLSIYLWNARYNRWQDELKKPIGSYVSGLHIGDLNNDGFNDILTGTHIGDFYIRGYLWNRAPIINIIDPQNNEIFGNQAPNFTVEVKDDAISTMWYRINNGLNKTFFDINGTINPILWQSLDNGNIDITFYANDTLGSVDSTKTTIKKDTIAPLVSINDPISGFFGISPPGFDITITESNTYTSWYSLNDGINITFTGVMGTINETEWEKQPESLVIIKFYVEDVVGLWNYDEISVQKDTIAPSSSIHFEPYRETNIVNDTTTFTITANDGVGSGVSVIRYKINDSDWIDYTNPFDLSVYAYGYYLISYQAIDLVDNSEIVNTVLVEFIEIPPESSGSPAIPGYNLYILIGVISIGSVILLKNRKKF